MAPSLERSCVEAVFFVALAVTTAVLHYTRGFSSAFPGLSSQSAAAAAANSPLYNYACLLAAATVAYATARTAACYAAAALPPKVKSSAGARRGALALFLPVTALVCYVGAGYPPLASSVVVRWVAGNWERNGERDLRWCGRLFVLLFFWQALLAAGIAVCRAMAGSVSKLVAAAATATAGGTGSGSEAGKKLEQQPRQDSDRSSSSSGKSWIGDGALPTARLNKSSGENGAPGWEMETDRDRDGAGGAPLKA